MTAEQFKKHGLRLFGSERGWQTRLATALGVDGASVTRWLSGTVPIPGPVRAAIECWVAAKRR